MTRNRRSPASAVLTGVTLAVTGALVAGLGYLGNQWSLRQDAKAMQSTYDSREMKRREAQDQFFQAFRERLDALPKLDLHVLGETATGPVMGYPDAFTELMESSVKDGVSTYETVFPGEEFVTWIGLYFTPQGSASGGDATSTWQSGSSSLSESAVNDPTSFRLYGYGQLRNVPVTFTVPSTGSWTEEWQKELNVLRKYFEGNVVGANALRGFLTVKVNGSSTDPGNSGWVLLATLLTRLSQLGLLFLLLAPPIWVFLDARRKRLPAGLWGLFVLPTSLLGILVYALANREAGPSCPECGERVSPRYAVCPYCRTELKGTCPTCGQTVGLNWHYCPSCSTEL